ncbi:MAG: YqjD family protein [Akkermansiaceae bacterium]
MTENPFSKESTSAAAASQPSPQAAASDLRDAASDFAKTTGEQAKEVKTRAVDAANALKASASEKADHYKAVATEKADHYKAVATEKADHYKAVATEKAAHVKDSAQQQWDETRVRAKEIHVTTEDYIRQNPTKAVLGALGVGFLIGLITRR